MWLLGGGNYGVFGHGMAHTGTGVERSSLPPDLLEGMGIRAKLLARHVSGARESVILVLTKLQLAPFCAR